MAPMKYLKIAQDIAEERGDDFWFAHYYTLYRENFNVKESAQRALHLLYGDRELIKDQ